MPLSAERVAVDDTATPLNTAGPGMRLTIATSADVDLGGADVEFGDGFRLTTDDPVFVVEIDPGQVLYAVADATADVQVLRT